jgi:hypothetical protein
MIIAYRDKKVVGNAGARFRAPLPFNLTDQNGVCN